MLLPLRYGGIVEEPIWAVMKSPRVLTTLDANRIGFASSEVDQTQHAIGVARGDAAKELSAVRNYIDAHKYLASLLCPYVEEVVCDRADAPAAYIFAPVNEAGRPACAGGNWKDLDQEERIKTFVAYAGVFFLLAANYVNASGLVISPKKCEEPPSWADQL